TAVSSKDESQSRKCEKDDTGCELPSSSVDVPPVPQYEEIEQCIYKVESRKKAVSLMYVFTCVIVSILTTKCFCRGNNLDCSDGRCDNRAMFTECPKNCLGKGNDCKNRRFAKVKYAAVQAFYTGPSKGFGVQAVAPIKKGQFIIEYVGEVVSSEEFAKRLKRYGRDPSHTHHYMFEIGSMIIDATKKGNCSRFMNHSCEPNAVCEKWYVPRTPCAIDRIGFFAKRDIELGEEITFDYQFENYGREAQRCFCGATACSGWIGKPPELLDDLIDEDIETESEDSDGSTDDDTKVMIVEAVSSVDTSLQHIFVANGLPNIFKSWLRTASPETLTRDDLNLKQCIIRSLLAMQSCAEAINVTILFAYFILCLRLESSI
uniref:Histone-lysine N-methyltransferase n=1 Tax=Angiostrongylus cantonensis TaxID=6313 RepID=A0A158P8N3_ANGCA